MSGSRRSSRSHISRNSHRSKSSRAVKKNEFVAKLPDQFDGFQGQKQFRYQQYNRLIRLHKKGKRKYNPAKVVFGKGDGSFDSETEESEEEAEK
mmetsp:Transcript_40418/g.61655  ORF Transcript_40418/g.61655 Transcript_40418/m.61655 type:complete len:94 (+) Transcript_40418:722-1003(+)